jgi:hypothetical protein
MRLATLLRDSLRVAHDITSLIKTVIHYAVTGRSIACPDSDVVLWALTPAYSRDLADPVYHSARSPLRAFGVG